MLLSERFNSLTCHISSIKIGCQHNIWYDYTDDTDTNMTCTVTFTVTLTWTQILKLTLTLTDQCYIIPFHAQYYNYQN